jgi:hypothetical protein
MRPKCAFERDDEAKPGEEEGETLKVKVRKNNNKKLKGIYVFFL